MKLFAGISAGALIVFVAFAVLVILTPPSMAKSCGKASWYGATGNRTASGSHYDGSQMIVAHRTLPFGTKLKVTYKGRSVVVTTADRGPFIRGRELDLSHAAAKKLGMINAGVASVCWVKL